jgi:hypothetical protein
VIVLSLSRKVEGHIYISPFFTNLPTLAQQDSVLNRSILYVEIGNLAIVPGFDRAANIYLHCYGNEIAAVGNSKKG